MDNRCGGRELLCVGRADIVIQQLNTWLGPLPRDLRKPCECSEAIAHGFRNLCIVIRRRNEVIEYSHHDIVIWTAGTFGICELAIVLDFFKFRR